MALYTSGKYRYRKRRSRRWFYYFVLLLILAAVAVFVYRKGYLNIIGNHQENESVLIRSSQPDKAEPIEDVIAKPQPKPQPKVEPVPEVVTAAENVVLQEPNSQIAQLLKQAMECINASPPRIIEARGRLNYLLDKPMSDHQQEYIKNTLSKLADQWLFSRRIYPQDDLCSTYRVKPGDRLGSISNQFKVPYDILMQINNISKPEALRAGDTIKVIKGPFNAKVYRSTFTMDLYLQDTFVRSFGVGLGQPGKETPTGLWRVKSDGRMIEPPWPDPVTGKILHSNDPEYALGSRWIGIEGIEDEAIGRTGFGIHGTKDPQTIGTASSRGCIRLHNGNAIIVYNVLMPVHSKIRVIE